MSHKHNNQREKKTRTLSNELFLSVGFVVISFWLVIGGMNYIMLKNALYKEKENLLESRIHNIPIDILVHINTQEDLLNNANRLMNEVIDPQIQCAIISKDGTIIATVDNSDLDALKERLLLDEQLAVELLKDMPYFDTDFYKELIAAEGFAGKYLSKNTQGVQYMSYFLKTGDLDRSSGMVQMSTDLTSVNLLILRQMIIYALLSSLMVFVVMLVLWVVTRRTLLPLNNMKKIIETSKASFENMTMEKSKLILQEQHQLEQITGQTEVLALAKTYSSMLTTIQNAFEKEIQLKNQMRQFVSDASHELRTPLTSIHGFAEVLEMGAYTDEDNLSIGLKSIMSESERMNTLVTNLLVLNRLDQNAFNTEDVSILFEKVKLQELFNEMLPQLTLLAGARKLFCHIKDPLEFICDRNSIKQVILNLVQNAVKFSQEDTGEIHINGFCTEKALKIEIQDNGKGIAPEHLPKIFDRFYRGENHRSRLEGGYGLGLAIVKGIVEQHNGEIFIESTLGEGTKVTMVFKRGL